MRGLRAWFDRGKGQFFLGLAGTGAAAGLLSWSLAWVLFPYLGTDRPQLAALVWAMVRGILFAWVIGLVLWAHFATREDPDDEAS